MRCGVASFVYFSMMYKFIHGINECENNHSNHNNHYKSKMTTTNIQMFLYIFI